MKIKESFEEDTEYYGDENKFRDDLAKHLEGKTISTESPVSYADINKIETNKKHPTKKCRPDIKIYHTGLKLKWRELSNPFFIECKDGRGFQKDLLQLLRYKYEKGEGGSLEKYGKYHVGYASPRSVLKDRPFKNSDYYSYQQFERTLWHLGLGLLKKGYREEKLTLTFNEKEQVLII